MWHTSRIRSGPSTTYSCACCLILHVALLPLAWGQPSCPSSRGDARLGAVASESSECSRIGTDVLKQGGNAVDAIIATVFCVGTIAMYHSGIAGGGFMVVRTSNGVYDAIDFRETAPAAAFEDMYKDNDGARIYGGLASGVPGQLRGLEYIHGRYAAMPWAWLLAPSIKLARHGFVVNQDLVSYMNRTSRNGFLTEDPAWAADFAPNGRRVELGDVMTRKRYADTLESIATDGADAFYTGSIARCTVAALQKANGTMTLEDLANYTIKVQKPVHLNYRGYRITSCNAPSSGVVALSALNTLSGYDGLGNPHQVNLTTHLVDEAIKFAYGQRTSLGDPAFVEGLPEYTEQMLSVQTGAEVRSRISPSTTQHVWWYDPRGLESLDTPGTSHMVTADARGMSVSLTTTINLIFGSRVMVPETGVIMNNEMDDFSIPGKSNTFGYIPSSANFIRPGKRPLSSISPVIVESPDGKLFFAVGAAGGSRITTATIQALIHALDEGMTTSQALAQPRLHDQLIPSHVSFEYAYNNSTVAYMKSLGHNVTWVAPGESTCQALRLLPNGTFEASGEPRQKNSGGFAV